MTVQITSDAINPIGRSRLGFFVSSVAVETQSNPMYEKKMMAAPAWTLAQPLGENGCQFSGLTYEMPTATKKARMSSLSNTMAALNQDDSLIPTTSTTVISVTT